MSGDSLAQISDTGRTGVFLRTRDSAGAWRDLTHGDADKRIGKTAAYFASLGLRPGSYLMIATADDEHATILMLTCLRQGVVALVADPGATTAECAAWLAIQIPDVAIVDAALATTWPVGPVSKVVAIAPRSDGSLVSRLLRRPAVTERYPTCIDGFPSIPATIDLDPGADAYVIYTSGSTGRPKGVRVSRGACAAHVSTLIHRWGYEPGSRILNLLPLHHADGMIQGVIVARMAGVMCVRPGRFRIDTLVEQLVDPVYREQITHVVVVPTMLALLLRLPDRELLPFRSAELRMVISTAGPLDQRVWAEFEQRTGAVVCNVYGLTESVAGGCFAGPDPASRIRGTVGIPVDCQVRIVGPDGAHVTGTQEGEIELRGALLMSGYLNDSEATNSTMHDGWLRTGDLGTVTSEGLVRVTGRIKNLVISGGENIHPETVSAVLREAPDVADAVAFGVPDPDLGEVLMAAVVMRDGAACDPSMILAFCRKRLGGPRVPKRLVSLPALPHGPSGKVSLPRLRDLVATALQHPGGSPEMSVAARIRVVASRCFGIPADRLGPDDAPGRTPGWDSFAHLSFITGLEVEFKIRIPAARLLALRSLAEAERMVDDAIGR